MDQSKIGLATQYKEQGNEAFKANRFYSAVDKYTKSLQVHVDPIVLGNRAQAELRIDLNLLAQIDCTKAIELNPSVEKFYYRRSLALKELGLLELAMKDAQKCVQICDSSAMKKLVDELKDKKNIAVLETCPIQRDDFLQSEKAFTTIRIEWDEPEKKAENAQTEDTMHHRLKKIPKAPRDYQDFVAGISSLSGEPLLIAEYFLRIDVRAYRLLFDDMLDNVTATNIIEAILCRLKTQKNTEKLAERMIMISKLSRFDLLLAMMSGKDHETINEICEFLSPEDAYTIRSTYS